MLMASCVTESKVVTVFELASKARWATMRSENSAEDVDVGRFERFALNAATSSGVCDTDADATRGGVGTVVVCPGAGKPIAGSSQ